LNKTPNQWAAIYRRRISIIKNKKLEKAAAVLAALIVWQTAAVIIDSPLLLATPLTVAHTLIRLCAEAEFWQSIGFSLVRIMSGFLLALAAGIVLAAAAGRFRIVEVLLNPYMTAVKSIPVASFIVLCLIWLSSRSLSVFVAFLIVLPVVYANVLHGIRSTDRKLLEMAYLFRMKWWKKLSYIYIPQLKPYLISACSVAIGMSWKAGVAAELIGIPEGSIGEKLYEAKVYLSTGQLFAWTVVIVIISVLCEKIFNYALNAVFKPR